MQLAIEIPDELGKQILQHDNVQEFVLSALKKFLLEEEHVNQQKSNFMIKEKNIKGHLPTTQSLMGLLQGSNLDESDYKKHLEDKYL